MVKQNPDKVGIFYGAGNCDPCAQQFPSWQVMKNRKRRSRFALIIKIKF